MKYLVYRVSSTFVIEADRPAELEHHFDTLRGNGSILGFTVDVVDADNEQDAENKVVKKQ